MSNPPKHVIFDVGGCTGWTLQKAEATSTTFIRCISDDEAERILEAASFCRRYGSQPTYRLLTSTYEVWRQTLARVANAKREEWTPDLGEQLLGAFVGWLLVWRLILDQAEHDLSTRFGSRSQELDRFRAARKAAYDSTQGYRIVEALRNSVQHREMPTVSLNRNSELEATSGRSITKISYIFPASYLLGSSKCPATIKNEFRDSPNATLEIPEVIESAMGAMRTVLQVLVQISVPELIRHVTFLRQLFSEASPVPPLLLRIPQLPAGSKITGLNIEMQPLLDLTHLVQSMPIP